MELKVFSVYMEDELPILLSHMQYCMCNAYRMGNAYRMHNAYRIRNAYRMGNAYCMRNKYRMGNACGIGNAYRMHDVYHTHNALSCALFPAPDELEHRSLFHIFFRGLCRSCIY